ncbi:MAG: hypothetical protein Q7R50_00495 [Dehalococcoidales bacterium]|nr:hypothetical protein [Dehalococcoidales bacterium]
MFNPEENAWRRGWEEYRKWVHDYMSSWILGFILPAVVTAAIEVIYIHRSPLTAAVYSLAAGLIGLAFLFLVSLIWHLISGLKQQRDEARDEILNVSAKLQEKVNVLNTSLSELVDLEVKHKILIETYQPIKELAAFKSGDIVKGKKFNVSLMFNQMNTSVISNITFENCTFLGPAVISLLGTNSELSGYSFSGAGTFDNVVVKEEPGKGYRGMCAFLNCKIRNCTFDNIGILGDDALKNKLKEGKSIP